MHDLTTDSRLRTGTVWSYQHLGVVPDILVCSKPLSAGVPFAVVATRPEIAQSLNQVSSHLTLIVVLIISITASTKLSLNLKFRALVPPLPKKEQILDQASLSSR